MGGNLYSVLGLSRQCSQEDIKAAYRKLAKIHHPDRHHGAPEHQKTEAVEKFREISEAYEILASENMRGVYDVAGRSAAKRAGASGHGSRQAAGATYRSARYSGHHRYKTNAEAQYQQSAASFLRMLRKGFTPANIIFHGTMFGWAPGTVFATSPLSLRFAFCPNSCRGHASLKYV
mmetsp:Transcript_22722/g.63109  ORF Transcript_22722/g.63109 Transcript_22722/m.63109 type:complete len:176 (+) Transcript_22722:239-766(+)